MRQREEAANATINRQLSVLLSMLRLAAEHNKLLRLPIVHKPKETAPRQGFFEADAYGAVRRRLPEDLEAARIAYAFGWRTQSEVLTLERRQVDLDAGTLRLDPGTTKDEAGRMAHAAGSQAPRGGSGGAGAHSRAHARANHPASVSALAWPARRAASARLPEGLEHGVQAGWGARQASA